MNCDHAWLQPLQRTQRTLAMGVHKLDPREVLERETWRLAANHLTQRWFPRSKNLAISELIFDSYRHALWWYPILQQRCHGTYRPTWYRGTLLTWFRRSVSMATGQWFYASYHIETAATSEAALAHAVELPGAGDCDWIEESLGFLGALAATGHLKSVIAQYILEVLAFMDYDRGFNEMFEYRAIPAKRRVLRAGKQGTAGYLRHGQTIHLVCNAHRMARDDSGLTWIDLREESVPFLDYIIQAKQVEKKGGWRLVAELQGSVMAGARANIKAIVTGKQNPLSRLHELRKYLYAFEANHRYATGARHQFIDISRYALSKFKRHLKTQIGAGIDTSLPHPWVTNTLIIPSPNSFLTHAPLEDWERWFSPRR